MQKTCVNSWCGTSFAITPDDLAFYGKLSASAPELQGVPPPTHCPDCRQQRRLARRNERSYYNRRCDLCSKEIIAMYAADVPFPVYCYACFWSDRWGPLSYGRNFDGTRPFLDQFQELQNAVPRIALFGKNNENCEFINHSVNSRNCYLCVDVAQCQDTYYSKWMIDCRDCCDCYQLEKSECCYESQYSVNLNHSLYAFLCDKSSNLAFCYDCEDCHDCFLCCHLRHKRFCIGNEQLSEGAYRREMEQWDFGSSKTLAEALKRYEDLWKKTFHRHQQVLFSENCSGDFIYHCKNVKDSFGVIESQDCRYCYDAGHMKDCLDAYEPAFDCELQYDAHGCNGGKRLLACHICYDNDALAYCDFCHNSSHLLGCIGLKRKQHCILNKQYSKEEYLTLLPRIIEQMRADSEWGSFFSVTLSPFAYNETVAQEYYPLTQEEVAARGWQWKEKSNDVANVERTIPGELLPEHTKDIPDDVLNWAITCPVTKRPFRLIRQELSFYRRVRLPIPRLHPDERYKRRMAFTNPRKLWKRECMKCRKEIQTTYSPERPEIVYCEECYLKEVY
jgi:hypothetical protein